MRNRLPALMAPAAAALLAAACGSSPPSAGGTSGTSSSPASAGTAVTTTQISGVTVLTSAKGFTLYWFVPDTSTKSNCNGNCAQLWPPVQGPAAAGPGVNGKLGTITRSDGSTQATYDGHPLYTYTADTAPGQANGINASGGVWHEVTASGAAAAASRMSASPSGAGGY
jgi:predicted lipoprotein with Yx(FWY)xxD motif